MNKDTLMMQEIDQIVLHSKCLDILRRTDITYLQAHSMIAELKRQYELGSQDYYEREAEDHSNCCEDMGKSDVQELINDDNRDRAADMNAVNRSPF